MMAEVASAILGISDIDEVGIQDMVGEVANTIAGNVQESFGDDFLISTPTVIKGTPKEVRFQIIPPTYIIPIIWKDYKCYIVVGVGREKENIFI